MTDDKAAVIGFVKKFVDSNCWPTADGIPRTCDNKFQLFYFLFAQMMYPEGFKPIPFDAFVPLLNNNRTENQTYLSDWLANKRIRMDFSFHPVYEDVIKQFDVAIFGLSKIALYYSCVRESTGNKDHTMSTIGMLYEQAKANLSPLSVEFWLSAASINHLIVLFLLKMKKRAAFRLLFLLWGLNSMATSKLFKTNLSAQTMVRKTGGPPFKTTKDLAELLEKKELDLGIRLSSKALIRYIKTGLTDELIMLRNALEVNPEVILPQLTFCEAVEGNPRVVAIDYEGVLDMECDGYCIIKAPPEVSTIFSDAWGGAIFPKKSKEVKRANILMGGLRLMMQNLRKPILSAPMYKVSEKQKILSLDTFLGSLFILASGLLLAFVGFLVENVVASSPM